MVPIMSYVDRGLEQIAREAELKGNINNNLKLGNKYNNDYLENYILNINNINNEIYKTNEKRNELRDIVISKLFNCFIYGECYYVLNGPNNNYRVKFHKIEHYKNQNYLKIQNLFKEEISDLENLIKCFNINYGDSETIINTINGNINNAYLWKCRCKDNLFEIFCNLLNSFIK